MSSKLANIASIAAFLFAQAAYAVTWNAANATVKVRSGLCHTNDFDYRGSGVLLRYQERVFALTSEHVLLHGNGEFCHSVSNEAIGLKQARLAAVDWSAGLALLELTGFHTDIPLPSITDIDSSGIETNSAMRLMGYPYDYFDQPFSDDQGVVATKFSHRHFLPRAGEVIELTHSHGEFGMSGGPVFDETGQKIAGILSHQYLMLAAGERPVVGEYSQTDANAANHLLLIAGDDAKSWVQRALGAVTTEQVLTVPFVKDATDQIAGTDIVYTSGLAFAAVPYERESDCVSSGVHNRSIGGDPIGVGGDHSSGQGPIKIEVSRDRRTVQNSSTEWYLPSKETWRQQLEELLLRPSTLTIPALVDRLGDGQLQKVCVYSLAEFFRKLTSAQADAITLVDGTPGGSDPNEYLEHLQANSKELDKIILPLRDDPNYHWSRIATLLFERLLTLDQVLQTDSWILLSSQDVDALANLQGSYKIAWQELFREHFNEGTDILAGLRRIEEDLQHIRL